MKDVSSKLMNKNLQAFLDTIAWSEGTSIIKSSDNGYNVIVGGKLFNTMSGDGKTVIDYRNHPHQLIHINQELSSTAAGRYQLLAKYYDFYRKLLKLNDFSPASQDAIAIQQIKECKAIANIRAGNFALAIKKCSRIWASFPGANYNQHEHKMEDLQAIYLKSGGTLAS